METNKTLDALHSDIMCVHNTTYEGGDFFHSHDGYELFLMLNGDMNFFIEQNGQHLSHSSLVCVKPYAFHRREVIQTDIYDRIVINIRENTMKSLSTEKTDLSLCFNSLPESGVNSCRLSEQETEQYITCSHKLIQALNSCEYGSDIMADSCIKQILVMVNRHINSSETTKPNNIMPPLVANTIAFIDEHITEEITLQILSDYFHHNGTYISRCFKNIAGITLQEYIISKKITLAKKYLREGYPPYKACDLTGFNNYSNFSRTFTKQVGYSPRKYQDNISP